MDTKLLLSLFNKRDWWFDSLIRLLNSLVLSLLINIFGREYLQYLSCIIWLTGSNSEKVAG